MATYESETRCCQGNLANETRAVTHTAWQRSRTRHPVTVAVHKIDSQTDSLGRRVEDGTVMNCDEHYQVRLIQTIWLVNFLEFKLIKS